MAIVHLLLGTNLGDKSENLDQARVQIKELEIRIIKESGIYESSPWGFDHPGSFYNQVIQIETQLEPGKLLSVLLKVEKRMGRTRTSGNYEARIIDLDILFYDNLIIQSENLIIPHPRLHLRKFTLEPLCEIAPQFIHPVFNKTIRVLLQECEDTGDVVRQ